MINTHIEEVTTTKSTAPFSNALDLLIEGKFSAAEESAEAQFNLDRTDTDNRKELCIVLTAVGNTILLKTVSQEGLSTASLQDTNLYLCFIAFCDKNYEDALNHFVAYYNANSNQHNPMMFLLAAELQKYCCLYTEAFYNYSNFVAQTSAAKIYVEKKLACLEHIEATQFSENLYNAVEEYLCHPNFDPDKIRRLASTLIYFKYNLDLNQPFLSLDTASQDKILVHCINKISFFNKVLELTFIGLRKQLLQQCLEDGCITEQFIDLCTALAKQAYYAEYCSPYEEVESETLKDIIALLEEELTQDTTDVLNVTTCTLLLAMYENICRLPVATELVKLPHDYWPNEAIETISHILYNPVMNNSLEKVKPFKPIENPWSVTTAELNNKSHYICWNRLAKNNDSRISDRSFDTRAYLKNHFQHEPINILIVGASTGKYCLEKALEYPQANIHAIDISGKRLAYACKMAKTQGIHNVKFYNLDINDIDELGINFHVIDMKSVMNHVEKPNQVIIKLLNNLQPNGLLKLNLNSSLANETVIQFKLANNKINFDTSLESIRELRSAILSGAAENLKPLAVWKDFYQTSACIKKYFVPCEHYFTLNDVETLIQEHNLDLLTLDFNSGQAPSVNQYLVEYPNDVDKTNLENWQAFEEINPWTFAEGYPLVLKKTC